MAGFFFANLLGLCILLCGWQFYQDVRPVLTGGDSFMQGSYAVVTKRVNALQTLQGTRAAFTDSELQRLAEQPFAAEVAPFTPARYGVYAAIGNGAGLSMGTDMFFESLPDNFIDADLTNWHYNAASGELPVIMPRSYLNLYNFGYAQARGLPALTEGMVGLVKIRFTLSGTNGTQELTGRVVGFSNRLNTILVPDSFMTESNARLSPEGEAKPSRAVVKLKSAADANFAQYLQDNNLEAEASAADGGRAAWFARLTATLVMGVGVIICFLALYVLMLSVLLLLQKHKERIRTLLLIGYSPAQVALPFHLLAAGLQLFSAALGIAVLFALRHWWAGTLQQLSPQWQPAPPLYALLLAAALLFFTAMINYAAVKRKVRE